jgi:uncharacterized delta-60 repeat protein
MKRITILLTLLLCTYSLAYAQTASLDKTFGDQGATVTSFSEKDAYGFQSLILPDGKILQSGVILGDDDGHEAAIFKYDENGKRDLSFGVGGRVKLFSGWPMYALRMTTYPDGRILMYGYENQGTPRMRPFVTRILSNGIIDSTFGVHGSFYHGDYKITARFDEVVLTGDNKILVVGTEGKNLGATSNTKPMFRRLTSDGHIDSSFGLNGILVIPLEEDSLALHTVCKDSTGRYLFVCKTVFQSNPEIVVFRADINGIVDTTFAEDGFMSLRLTDGDYNVPTVMVLSDSSIIFNVNIRNGLYANTTLVKLTKLGMLDPSFGSYGTSLLLNDKVSSPSCGFAIDSLGRIIAAGHTYFDQNGVNISVFRYHSDGMLDSSFGVNGVFTVFPNSFGEATGIIIQKDGKYLITGEIRLTAFTSNLICRIDPNATSGVRGCETTNSSISLYPTPTTDNCTITYTLPKNSDCSLTLRDESGREVRTFMTDEYSTAGRHEEELDLRGLASGVYFLSLEHEGNIETVKVVVSR